MKIIPIFLCALVTGLFEKGSQLRANEGAPASGQIDRETLRFGNPGSGESGSPAVLVLAQVTTGEGTNRVKRVPPPSAPGSDASRTALRRCIYRAPRFGPRRIRTISVARSDRSSLPKVQALAPDHPGLTMNAHPRLYYYLSEPVKRLELTLVSFRQPQPLLQLQLTEGVEAGIHELDLAEQGVMLPSETEYEWHVVVVRDPRRRSRDVVSRAMIKRIEPDSTLHEELQDGDPWRQPVIFAEAGLWYDALQSLITLQHQHPDDPAVRESFQSLLRQVELTDVPVSSPVSGVK